MKNRFLNILIILIFLFCGCATLGNKVKDNRKKEDIQLYLDDLDNDKIIESIEVYDKAQKHKEVSIAIAKHKKPRLASLTVPGTFKKIEIIDLNEDGFKQIALYYEEENENNLVIYNFKDGKLSKIFSLKNKCLIETDFTSMLARIKIGKPKPGESDCSLGYPEEWETLVWTGEKFIKEKK
jgi:hypothetical protein